MPKILYEVIQGSKEQIVREKLGKGFTGSAVVAAVTVEGHVDLRNRRALYSSVRRTERQNPQGLYKVGSCIDTLQLTKRRWGAVPKNVAHSIEHLAVREVAEEISRAGNLRELYIGGCTSIYRNRDNLKERIPVVVLYSSRLGMEVQLERSLVAAIEEVAEIINR